MKPETAVEHTVRFARWRYDNADGLNEIIPRLDADRQRLLLGLLESAYIQGWADTADRLIRAEGIRP